MRAAKFRAEALPPRNCSRPIDCTGPSPCNFRMTAKVRSVEPSSTQTISKRLKDCRRKERTHFSIASSSL
jgi:hypothetical protein